MHPRRLSFALAVLCAGCASILGIGDLPPADGDAGADATAHPDATADAPADGGPDDAPTTSDAPDGSDAGDAADANPDAPAECDGPCTPEVIATGQKNPLGIAVDANNVYWTDWGDLGTPNGALMQSSLGSFNPIPLATGQYNATGVAVDSQFVYWANAANNSINGIVQRVPIGGGQISTIASGISCAAWLAIDTVNAYFTGCGIVEGAPLSGTKVTFWVATNLTGASPNGIAADGLNVYWADQWNGNAYGDSVMQGGVDGGFKQLVANQDAPWFVALDATYVYWANINTDTINKFRKDGTGSVVTIANGQASPTAVAVDGSYVYWANTATQKADGSICKAPLGGGSVKVLAAGQAFPGDIAIDDYYVYWTNQGDGTVVRVPK